MDDQPEFSELEEITNNSTIEYLKNAALGTATIMGGIVCTGFLGVLTHNIYRGAMENSQVIDGGIETLVIGATLAGFTGSTLALGLLTTATAITTFKYAKATAYSLFGKQIKVDETDPLGIIESAQDSAKMIVGGVDKLTEAIRPIDTNSLVSKVKERVITQYENGEELDINTALKDIIMKRSEYEILKDFAREFYKGYKREMIAEEFYQGKIEPYRKKAATIAAGTGAVIGGLLGYCTNNMFAIPCLASAGVIVGLRLQRYVQSQLAKVPYRQEGELFDQIELIANTKKKIRIAQSFYK